MLQARCCVTLSQTRQRALVYITVTVDFDVTGKAVCGGAH